MPQLRHHPSPSPHTGARPLTAAADPAADAADLGHRRRPGGSTAAVAAARRLQRRRGTRARLAAPARQALAHDRVGIVAKLRTWHALSLLPQGRSSLWPCRLCTLASCAACSLFLPRLTVDSVLSLSRLLTAHFSAVGAAAGSGGGGGANANGGEAAMPPPLLPSTSQLHTVLRLLLRPTDRAARPFEIGPPARAASGLSARSRM